MSDNLDVLRAYTRQFAVELDAENEDFLPHQPIEAAEAAELVRKWSFGSVNNPTGDPRNDKTWTLLQAMADDYGIPIDEFLGAVWFVAQHNGAYKDVQPIRDQIGCAMGEVIRVLQTVSELRESQP